MRVINIMLNGDRDHVANELTEAATDSPETEIRRAVADWLQRNLDEGDDCSVSVSVTLTGD